MVTESVIIPEQRTARAVYMYKIVCEQPPSTKERLPDQTNRSRRRCGPRELSVALFGSRWELSRAPDHDGGSRRKILSVLPFLAALPNAWLLLHENQDVRDLSGFSF